MKDPSALEWSRVADADLALVERAVGGDEAAFGQIMEEHHRMVVTLAYRLLGDYDEALDVSQDAFLRVYSTLPSFRCESTLKTWIYRIVINLARNRLRWHRRRHRDATDSIDQVEGVSLSWSLGSSESAPDRVMRRKELAIRVREAVAALPFNQRSALVLREIEGLSYEEIGDTLRIPVGTVKSRLARARETLRDELRDELDGGRP